MARSLASIQKIVSVEPIPGADSIEVATVLGWHCVVKKGEFSPGDLCVYFEIDSLLPQIEQFDFLRSRGTSKIEDGTTGYKVRTIRLRKQVSQGLALRPDLFPELAGKEEGDDVTELLNVVKWEPIIPANMRGMVKGTFPDFIPKTDETRVQNLKRVLTRYTGTRCYVTEKIDGTSVTYYVKDGVFGVCSRNQELQESEDNLYWKIATGHGIEEKLRSLNKNIAIQGEIFGAGVQGNPLMMPSVQVKFFNVFDIDSFSYYSLNEAFQIIHDIHLDFVPIVDSEFILHDDIDKIVEYSIGKSVINPKKWREGVVIRPLVERLDLEMSKGLNNARLSFKAINPEYLLVTE